MRLFHHHQTWLFLGSLFRLLAVLVAAGSMGSTHLKADEPPARKIDWRASGTGGAVSAGRSTEVVAAALDVLAEGGTAADAAATSLLGLSVTEHGLFASGGEVPLLIYDAKRKEVKVLSGLGRAPLDPRAIEWFFKNGIPSGGSMKSAPVPGMVHLVSTLLIRYGTVSFERAVRPTLAILDRKGRDWHPRLAVTLRKLVEAERRAKGSRTEKIAAARDRFYKGDIADELEKWYIRVGSFLRKKDLAAHRTPLEDPVTVSYRGYKIHKCGPWTQGPYLCQTLSLLEGFDLKSMGHFSADYLHTVVEALKLAMADRDEFYGDPEFVKVPLKQLLSPGYARMRRGLIDPKKASLKRRPGDPLAGRPLRGPLVASNRNYTIPVQDTTTCLAADRFGNVVAATPSCNLVGNQPGPPGVTQGNRLRSLNTTPGHPNRIQPGKRPRITLTPTLVTREGKPVIAVSVAGGDLQDQVTLNVLLSHIDFGLAPHEAVVVPRFATGHHQGSFDPNPDRGAAFISRGGVTMHSDVPEPIRRELSARGHKLRVVGGAIAHPVMLVMDPKTGAVRGAGDPRVGRRVGVLSPIP